MTTSLQATQNNAQKRANDIILRWKSPAFARKVLVLVEGKNDKEFYFKFFKIDTTAIVACDNCGKVIDVFNLLRGTNIVNLAIKDSDFDRLNRTTFPYGIFLSDAHDYEMMCLSNYRTRQELFRNLAIPYDQALIATIFNDLKYLSYFKWFNYTFCSKYNFKPLSVNGVTVGQISDYDYIQNIVRPAPPSSTLITKNALEQFIQSKRPCDCYEITVGHDFIQRLCHHLKLRDTRFNNVNENKIRTILHPCFRMEEFCQTALHHDIRCWQERNGISILEGS